MQIQCECGKFQAELTGFPRHTPGRLACYCDDCQIFLHSIGREDLLDSAGGTEVIPVYPSELKFIQGQEFLKCTRLSPHGLFRWSTTCCNTPIGNMRSNFPWIGLIHGVYTVKDPSYLERTLGSVKSRIQGRFARGTPPAGTSQQVSFHDMMTVLPFLLKGFLLRKAKPSPFFQEDGETPLVQPQILSLETKKSLREKIGLRQTRHQK